MKILFAIQGTGNGHLSRAREIIPHLLNYGDIDLLVSGTESQVELPYLVRYKRPGLSFTFGKKGGIDILDSVKKFRPFKLMKDIFTFPVENYDVVINDFEPVTAWACRIKGKPCYALSHQAAYLSKNTPRPLKKDPFAEGVLKHFAPSTYKIGFHFSTFDEFIYTPVIRSQVREAESKELGHITVYLPAYDELFLMKYFRQFPEVRWEVFSKHRKTSYREENIEVKPVLNDDFIRSLATSNGLLTNGGFEAPAEAIHLGKKVLSIPMTNQYEQQCNAVALGRIGGTVISGIGRNFQMQLNQWLYKTKAVDMNYPDLTARLVGQLITHAAHHSGYLAR
jgi:uncharacterized protein (TIGR00661 family)